MDNYEEMEFDGTQRKEYLDQNGNPVTSDIRFATIIFIPNVGANSTNPPIKLAYDKVHTEAEKVAFKYDQLYNWDYYCGILVNRNMDVNGTPGVLIRMPYSIINEDLAKKELIKYAQEICLLTKIPYVEIYYNVSTTISIDVENEESINICENKANPIITCNIDAGIVAASRALYPTVIDKALDPASLFIYGKSELVTSTLMISAYNGFNKIEEKLKESISRQLKESGLNFTGYTVI